jgi:glycosyltransferase involved in cell wall biosynthesis
VIERRIQHAGQYASLARWLRRQVAGTSVLVSKPRPTSLGLALLAGIGPGSLLLDIDDWEVGFRRPERITLARAWRDARDLLDPTSLNSYLPELALDRLAPRFPHRLVSNRWLQARFGGAVLPHVRDTDVLDPARVDRAAGRRELEMGDRVWVGFIGTARAHKGVDDLVDALALLSEPGLFLAGMNPGDMFVAALVERARARLGPERVRVVGQFGFAELPRWSSLPDILCVPSRDEPGAIGQIPAKLFDAMAMAQPVVASRVNDIEDALEGCGVVVEPGDVKALSSAIAELSRDENRRRELGDKARARAVERFSYRAAQGTLRQALAALERS